VAAAGDLRRQLERMTVGHPMSQLDELLVCAENSDSNVLVPSAPHRGELAPDAIVGVKQFAEMSPVRQKKIDCV
jgi:hypothetical protein